MLTFEQFLEKQALSSILSILSHLTLQEKKQLEMMLGQFSKEQLFLQREVVKNVKVPSELNAHPKAIAIENSKNITKPFGAILLAGGQGTRLGLLSPKGCFELEKGVTLFQVIVSKLNHPLGYLAVMTSFDNHLETIEHFEKNHFFGLDRTQVDFFSQDVSPILDENLSWFLNEKKELSKSPSGNGSVYGAFVNSPIFKKWKENCVHTINILPVDNFLASPQDEALIHQIESGKALAIKAIEKESLHEPIGTLMLSNNCLKVVEYSEKPMLGLGYSGLCSLSIDFFEQAASQALPLHLAKKKGKKWSVSGVQEVNVYKFETFLFDAFEFAPSFVILNSCRKKTFCPLKNKTGKGGIEYVQNAYQEFKK